MQVRLGFAGNSGVRNPEMDLINIQYDFVLFI